MLGTMNEKINLEEQCNIFVSLVCVSRFSVPIERDMDMGVLVCRPTLSFWLMQHMKDHLAV